MVPALNSYQTQLLIFQKQEAQPPNLMQTPLTRLQTEENHEKQQQQQTQPLKIQKQEAQPPTQHSVVLQAVCTADMSFTDCYVRQVGSVHDATVFRRSDLYERTFPDTGLFPNDSHMVGNAAYPLLTQLSADYLKKLTVEPC